MPSSARIEALREEGAPEVMTDNLNTIAVALATIEAIPGQAGPQTVDPYGHGCATGGSGGFLAGVLSLLGLVALLRAWRSGPSSRA